MLLVLITEYRCAKVTSFKALPCDQRFRNKVVLFRLMWMCNLSPSTQMEHTNCLLKRLTEVPASNNSTDSTIGTKQHECAIVKRTAMSE